LTYTNSVSTKYPINDLFLIDLCFLLLIALFFSISSHSEPHNYNEASKNTCWKQAMQEELNAFDANHSSTLEDGYWLSLSLQYKA